MKRYTQFDLKKHVLNIDGTKALTANATQTELVEYTVRDAFRFALNGVYPDENNPQTGQQLSFEKKMERYNLSVRIYNADGTVDLSTEEQAELKLCVGKRFTQPEVCGFLNAIMESKPVIDLPNVENENKKNGAKPATKAASKK